MSRRFYAIQFHPEVRHTINGQTILKNFIFDICKATAN
jgi:GMP synthase (glutamine-hydrolysing)